MSKGSVEIRSLVKTYVDTRGKPAFTAVKNINLKIEDGVFYGSSRPFRLRKIDNS